MTQGEPQFYSGESKRVLDTASQAWRRIPVCVDSKSTYVPMESISVTVRFKEKYNLRQLYCLATPVWPSNLCGRQLTINLHLYCYEPPTGICSLRALVEKLQWLMNNGPRAEPLVTNTISKSNFSLGHTERCLD